MYKSSDPTGIFILRQNQAVRIPVWLGTGKQLEHVARKSFGGVWPQGAKMPQLMQLWGIGIVEAAIQHNQVVFRRNGSGTWNSEIANALALRLEIANLADVCYPDKAAGSMEFSRSSDRQDYEIDCQCAEIQS